MEGSDDMSDILLDTGTGELEIMEFIINGQHYAINVLKLKGIVQLGDITAMPNSASEVIGLSNIRGDMVPVIDLKQVLFQKRTSDLTKAIALLCEFNGIVIAFVVDHVQGIRRVKWENIKRSNILEDSLTIGTLLAEDAIILLLDFESITISAQLGSHYDNGQASQRSDNPYQNQGIVLAEDSHVIAEMLAKALQNAGFKNIIRFSNGQEANDFLFELKEKLGEQFKAKASLLISDIEMPILDGYTLTKRVKEDEILKNMPVILFSSLITDALLHKGNSVGADIQINKPSTDELLEGVYRLLKEYE